MSTDLKEVRGGSSEEGTCEGRLRIRSDALPLPALPPPHRACLREDDIIR